MEVDAFAAFDPQNQLKVDSVMPTEDDAWMVLQNLEGRSLHRMEEEGWTVKPVKILVDF